MHPAPIHMARASVNVPVGSCCLSGRMWKGRDRGTAVGALTVTWFGLFRCFTVTCDIKNVNTKRETPLRWKIVLLLLCVGGFVCVRVCV